MKSLTITCEDVLMQAKGNIVSDMDGEKVMLNVDKGKYYNLGEVGGVIWDLLGEPKAVSELISYLVSDYDIEQAECERQVIAFLGQLLDEGLIEAG